MAVNQYHIQLLRRRIDREEAQYQQFKSSYPQSAMKQIERYGADIENAVRDNICETSDIDKKLNQKRFIQSITRFLTILTLQYNYFSEKDIRFLLHYFTAHSFDEWDLTVNLMEETYSAREQKQLQEEEARLRRLAEKAVGNDDNVSATAAADTAETVASLFGSEDDEELI